MLTLHELERHFSYLDPALLEIVLELRNLVAELAPQATERILRSGLSYHDAARGWPVDQAFCGYPLVCRSPLVGTAGFDNGFQSI